MATPPTTVFTARRVITMDPALPDATTVAVSDGRIVGSGIGSVPVADIVAALPELALEIANGTLRTQARAVPLKDVEQVWQQPENGQRVVFTPCRGTP